MHGGTRERAPRGAPERGGRPPSSFLYARVLRLPGDAEILEAARGKVGSLDDELALVRRNLNRALERHELQPKGGIPISVGAAGSGVTVLPNHSAVLQLIGEIRKLTAQRALLLQQAPPVDDDLETYDAWLAAARSPSEPSSSGSSS